jgi:hypothetical protein
MDDEHLGCLVTVLRVKAAARLASGTDVEAVRLRNVDVLVWVFGDARPDDGEVLFLV